jgi:hypothetical protein
MIIKYRGLSYFLKNSFVSKIKMILTRQIEYEFEHSFSKIIHNYNDTKTIIVKNAAENADLNFYE